MKTIVVGSQKGGSGKTSLVRCLAVQAEQAGDGPAWIIDSDQQGTLSEWHQKRQGERPQRGEVELGRKTPDEITRTLRAALDRLERQQGAEWCFIDTAPADTDENGAIYGVADFSIDSCTPIPGRSAGRAGDIGADQGGWRPIPVYHHAGEAKRQIDRTDHCGVIEAWTGDAGGYGRPDALCGSDHQRHTAPELWPRSLAAHEIALLWDEVKAFFAENINSTNHEMRIANG